MLNFNVGGRHRLIVIKLNWRIILANVEVQCWRASPADSYKVKPCADRTVGSSLTKIHVRYLSICLKSGLYWSTVGTRDET